MPLKPEESLIGKTFEKCRILAKLGTGGMGSVYMAEHFGLGRKVALKILPIEMSRDPEYVGRFMREATTAGRMEHPNIVQIHDVGYAEGRHFIVMQYVDGESLSTVVDELGAMEPRDAALLAVGILNGLQHAHEQGIVHRDVKPDNVLITKGNEPKLLDFGLAIETEASLHITRDGMVVGTPYYLSPEQARGHKATPICDVYATGVTLYYLVTGKRPFVGATALAVLNKHIHEKAIPPMQHNKAVPRTLNDIILKMMAKKPEDRYPTAGEAAAALSAYLEGRRVDAKVPVRFSDLPRRFLQLPMKLRIAAGAGAAALFLLIGVLLALPGKPAPTTTVRSTESPTGPSAAEMQLLADARNFEKSHASDPAAWKEVLDKYGTVASTVSDGSVKQKAEADRDRFALRIEQAADAEYKKLKPDPDPVARRKELDRFPKPLLTMSKAGALVQAELDLNPQLVEKKFDDADAKALQLAETGRFREARDLVASMQPWAPATRKDRLQKLEGDLGRLETEFNDPLAQAYLKVHETFERRLTKRLVKDAYDVVLAFLKQDRDPAESDRLRAPGLNYERVFAVRPDSGFPVELLDDARISIAEALQKGTDRVAYQALCDLLDALDIAWLFQRTGVGVNLLSQSRKEVAIATFGAVGRVAVGPPHGLNFIPKSGAEKKLVIGELRPGDLVLLAAAAEDQSVDSAFKSSRMLARAAGTAWLHSEGADRLSEAVRWYAQAAQLGAPGPMFRLDKVREAGRKDARTKLAKAQADARDGKFDAARRAFADLESLWSFDPAMKSEIGRATAGLLSSEIPRAAEKRDHARVKSLARELRQKYEGQFDEAAVVKAYAHALRGSGFWEFVPTELTKPDTWLWEAKGTGAPAPVKDEGASTGLRFPSGVAVMTIAPIRVKGRTGLSLQARIVDRKRPCTAGIRFDVTDDGRYKLLAIEWPGRIALYQVDGSGRKELKSVPLDPKIAAEPWIDLAYMAEGGDIVCTVNQQPILWLPLPVAPDRPVQISADGEVNFRQINLRR